MDPDYSLEGIAGYDQRSAPSNSANDGYESPVSDYSFAQDPHYLPKTSDYNSNDNRPSLALPVKHPDFKKDGYQPMNGGCNVTRTDSDPRSSDLRTSNCPLLTPSDSSPPTADVSLPIWPSISESHENLGGRTPNVIYPHNLAR